MVGVPGARLFVSTHGDGRPLLLINGLGGSHAMWEPLVGRLADFHTIAFDAPGTGLSPPTAVPPTIPCYAQMIQAMVARLGHDRVDVLGYSFGGGVAQELARRAPEMVRRLVLVAATCGWGGVPAKPGAAAALSTPLRMYSRVYYQATALALAGGEIERDPKFVAYAEALRRRHAPNVGSYFGQLLALACWSSLPWLHSLKPPTLVINGEDDPVVPWANGALLASEIPEARLHTQRRGGHYLLLDKSSSVMSAIADFLAADDHRSANAWCDAITVSRTDAYRAAARSLNTAQPHGAMSAIFRALCELNRPPEVAA
jgi:pimeloyl-ACP methyl ester carboxylesterase